MHPTHRPFAWCRSPFLFVSGRAVICYPSINCISVYVSGEKGIISSLRPANHCFDLLPISHCSHTMSNILRRQAPVN
ncbi:hypothetical protein F5146DRAFT_1077078 [Armillaria mellea]|nr:hypothetical protein F5146DRAFT_1077078 [Armillaria mellea]